MTGIEVSHETHEGAIVAHARGLLDVAGYPLLRDALLKCAAEVPDLLVVDVAGLQVDRASTLSVFSTVLLRISTWPEIPMAIAAPGLRLAELLVRSAVTRFVPIHESVEEALAAAGGRSHYRRARTALPVDVGAPAILRGWTRATLQRWAVMEVDEAVLVASELVTNAIVHTPTAEVSVRLELRPSGLSVAVEDLDPRPPEPVEGGHGRGLHLVAGLTRAWGHGPTLAGGKVVWAVMPLSELPYRPPQRGERP
jgi:anti-sigma regulatory factor (Ser/Thr protein kinase)